MTTPTRFERNLPGILDDLSAAPTPEYLDDVFVRTGRMRQRPAWTFPERWLPMADITRPRAFAVAPPWRTIAVALVVLALLVAAALVYVGSHQRRVPAPFGPARNGLIPYAVERRHLCRRSGHRREPCRGRRGRERLGTQLLVRRDVDRLRPRASATTFDIYVVRPDGRELRRITSSPLPNRFVGPVGAGQPARRRHPPGRMGPDAPLPTAASASSTSSMSATGSVQTVAQADGMDYVQFRPPDARELLYRARVDGKWGLFAMDADGTNVRPVVPPDGAGRDGRDLWQRDLLADGSRIFFDQYTLDASAGEPGCCQLFVVNADGSDLHKFIPKTGDGTWDGEAVVSPDGNLIAFWHNLPDRPTQRVTVVRADGTGPLIETGPDLSGRAHWIWAPDSSAILMFPNDVDTGKAYLLDPAGGPWKAVPWTSSGDLDWQRLAPPD